jgi:hypothetical protein
LITYAEFNFALHNTKNVPNLLGTRTIYSKIKLKEIEDALLRHTRYKLIHHNMLGKKKNLRKIDDVDCDRISF